MAKVVQTKKKIERSEKIIYAVFAYMIFMFMIIVAYRGAHRMSNRSVVERVNLVGRYSVDNGENYLDYSQYKPRKSPMGTRMIFEGNFSNNIAPGQKIWMRVENVNVRVSINGEQVYIDDKFDDYKVWDFFTTEEITPDDEVRIEMEVKNKIPFNFLFSLLLNSISVGTKYALTKASLLSSSVYIGMSIFVFLMGFVLIPYCFQLKYLDGEKANTEGMMSCSFMLMFGALNCLMNQKYTGLLFENTYFITYFAYIVKMLTSVFIVRYVDKYLTRENFKIITRIFCFINVARVILFMAAMMMTGDDAVSRVTFMYNSCVGLAILLITMLFVIMDYKSGERENGTVIISTVVLILFLIIEILFYILTGTYITGMLSVGLLIFTVTEWHSVSKKNLDNLKLVRRAQELENELTQNQVKIMISQIQPHFLYNALGTIRALCVKDPQTARQAIDSFAKYLRANMDSLNNKECIPFSKELEHTKCYLFIEQLRFGDLLKVEYDIHTEDFAIPALSLQTMAENAVKHGLLAKREGGTLRISTFESNTCYEVRIEDDGVGFDITKSMSEDRSHVGVANTRQRITAMCGGHVSIGSKPGVGTTITIVIPKQDIQ